MKPQRGLLKWERAACMRFAFEMRLLEFNKNVLLSHKKYLNILFLSLYAMDMPRGNLHKWMRIGIVQFGKQPLPARRRKTKPGSAPSAVLAPCGCILWLVCLVCCFLLLSSLWARPINKCAKRLGPTHAHTDTRSHTLTHAWALITHNQLKFISPVLSVADCESL